MGRVHKNAQISLETTVDTHRLTGLSLLGITTHQVLSPADLSKGWFLQLPAGEGLLATALPTAFWNF